MSHAHINANLLLLPYRTARKGIIRRVVFKWYLLKGTHATSNSKVPSPTRRECKHLHTAVSKMDASPPTMACNALIYITLTGQATCVVKHRKNKQSKRAMRHVPTRRSPDCQAHLKPSAEAVYFNNGHHYTRLTMLCARLNTPTHAMVPNADYNKTTLAKSFAPYRFLRPRHTAR